MVDEAKLRYIMVAKNDGMLVNIEGMACAGHIVDFSALSSEIKFVDGTVISNVDNHKITVPPTITDGRLILTVPPMITDGRIIQENVDAEPTTADPKSSYYDAGGIETIKIMKAKLTAEQYIGFLLGNIIKYSTRANFKDSFDRDIEKVGVYTKLLAEARGDVV